MSNHLGNLKRLHQKLSLALGDSHPLALQLQRDIESYAEALSKRRQCVPLSLRRPTGRSSNHRWKYLCNASHAALPTSVTGCHIVGGVQ